MDELELRSFPVDELRAVAPAGESGPKITGYAALFNKRSAPMYGMIEIIAPGAFTNALKRSDVRALWNHDPLYVLGRQKSGTLSVEQDERGLKIENTPPDTQWAKDLLVSIERGDVAEMSFGFRVEKDKWDQDGDTMLRTILEVRELRDVSPVTFPAYSQTKVALRSFEQLAEEGRRRLHEGTMGVLSTDTRRRRLKIS